MKTLYRRSLSALLALLLAGQMVPAALASPEPEASKTPEEIGCRQTLPQRTSRTPPHRVNLRQTLPRPRPRQRRPRGS